MAKQKFKINVDEIDSTITAIETETPEPEVVEAPEQQKRKVNQKSLDNLRPREPKADKQPKSYIPVDIKDNEDYLKRMSKFTGMSVNKYIASLIQADYELNKGLYEQRLVKDSNLDWEKRKPTNTSKK